MVKNHQEEYFVEIVDPGEVRKNILETLREILNLLQQFEKLKQIRQQRMQAVQSLRTSMRSAHKMMGNVKSMLPQTSLKASSVKEEKKEKPHAAGKKHEEKEKKVVKKATEMERLESELSAIESKLRSLN